MTPVTPRAEDAAPEQRDATQDELQQDTSAQETEGAPATADAAGEPEAAPAADAVPADEAYQEAAEDAAPSAEAPAAAADADVAEAVSSEDLTGAMPFDEGPSEDSTSVFELDDADETPTTLLSMDDVDETPTTVLSAEDDEASEDPTALFTAEEEDPTSALEVEADPDETPTTLLSDDEADEADAVDEADETPTTLLSAEEADETPTTLLSDQDAEDIDSKTTVLSDPDEVERAEAAADAAAAEQSLWAEPGADAKTTVLPETNASHDGGAARQVSWQQAAAGQLPFNEQGQQGQQVPQTAQVPPQPQDGQPPFQEEQPAKKTHRGLIIGIIAVIVVAIAVACAFLIPRFMGSAGTVVAYGQTDPVELSPTTRVRPRDAEGNELTSYVVKLVKRVSDDDGGSTKPSEGISDVVAQIEVNGPDGFTMEDFGDDIPAGDYTIVIVKDGSSSSNNGQQFPVHYDPDSTDDGEVVVQPDPEPSTGSDTDTGTTDTEEPEDDEFTEEELAAAYYSAKLSELTDRYGSATVVTPDDSMVYAMEGLAYAGLYDFDGDGLDELLTIVTDGFDTSDPEHVADIYQVAVWDYQDGELVQVFDGVAPYSNGGAYFLDIYEYEDKPVIDTMVFEDNDLSIASRMGQDGDAFTAICESQCVEIYEPEYKVTYTYYVDGSEVEEADYQAVMDEMVHLDHICLVTFADPNDPETTESYTEDGTVNVLAGDALIDATYDTMTSLEKTAGDALDYVLELLAEETEAAGSYTATVEEQTETFESSQGEGLEWEQNVAWCYPVITLEDGSTNDVLDELNKSFADDYAADLAAAKAWTFDSGDEQVTVHRDQVTYLEGSIACVRSDRSVFYGGNHGTESIYGTFYDLTTGDVVDVDEALGLSWSDLQAEAEEAVTAYVDGGNTDMTMDDIDPSSISAVLSEKTRYLADENGVYVAFWSYELGSYASGVHLVYVHGFGDDSIVGTSAGVFEWGQ